MKAIKTPFRWYVGDPGESELSNLNRQFWKRSGGNDYALLSPVDSLLPFQFFLPAAEAIAEDLTVLSWEIVDATNNLNRISLYGERNLISVFQAQEGLWYSYLGEPMPGLGALAGKTWYSVVKLLSNRYIISERFRVACTAADQAAWVEMNWWNDCDMAGIVYQTGFRNLFYSDYPLDALEPLTYEEGTENGIKQFIPSLQIQYDQWRLQGLFPDYVYEALVAARTHKNLQVFSAGNYMDMRIKDVSGDWEGDLALVTAKLEDQERKLVSACCGNLTQQALFPPVAQDDTFIVRSNPGQTVYSSPHSVLDNDSGQGLHVVSVSPATSGCSIAMNPDGTFTVTTPPGWEISTRVCQFSYVAKDAFGTTITANVHFSV